MTDETDLPAGMVLTILGPMPETALVKIDTLIDDERERTTVETWLFNTVLVVKRGAHIQLKQWPDGTSPEIRSLLGNLGG